MDISVSDAYLRVMLGRVATILAMLVIAFVTTAAFTHAVRMNVGPGHAVHMGEMIHGADNGAPSCDVEQHCGSADAGPCEVLCAGSAVFLTTPGVEAGHALKPASHDAPSASIHTGRATGPNERPPEIRLI